MNAPHLTTLPDVIVGCISSFLTIGQLSNVGTTCHTCHRQFWLENDVAWTDQIGVRFHSIATWLGGEETQLTRDVVIRNFNFVDRMHRGVIDRVTDRCPDLPSLLFDDDGPHGVRVFAYVHTHELKSAVREITKQQRCGSGVLHVVRGDVDLIEALAVMDASRETESFTASGRRQVCCYLAEWPPQTRENDLVLILTGALQCDVDLLRKVPHALQPRVLLVHRQGVEVSETHIQTLIESTPRVAVTDSFCQRPNYASVLGGVGSSREFALDLARLFLWECGKGSPRPQTTNLRTTLIP